MHGYVLTSYYKTVDEDTFALREKYNVANWAKSKECKKKTSSGGFGSAQEACPITCNKCRPEEDSREASELGEWTDEESSSLYFLSSVALFITRLLYRLQPIRLSLSLSLSRVTYLENKDM